MSDRFEDLQDRQQQFIDNRDWSEYHTPKSLSMAISIEAAELMELFQWHDNLSAEEYRETSPIEERVEDELADILIYSLSMASEFDISLSEVVDEKLDENEERFDEEKSASIRNEIEGWQKD